MVVTVETMEHPIRFPPGETGAECPLPDWEKLRTIKRYRMECQLAGTRQFPPCPQIKAYRPELLQAHAEVLVNAFVNSPDLGLFPGLGSTFGCQAIMEAIVAQSSFLPGATLLAVDERQNPVASIQAMSQRQEGLIMNVGVVPSARGQGWGKKILQASLDSMARDGLALASLEVSGGNQSALNLYRGAGFRKTRVQYLPLQDLERPDRPGFWDLPLDLW